MQKIILSAEHCLLIIMIILGIFLVIEIKKRNKYEKALQKKSHDLGERVKELNCLHEISKLVEGEDISLEKIYQEIVDLIPRSWQYPEITCSRIIIDSKEYKTKCFKKTIWKQSSEILKYGNQVGVFEVYYLEEKPEIYEGPFLKEERTLINVINERLGHIVEHKQAEEEIQNYTEQLERRVQERTAELAHANLELKIAKIKAEAANKAKSEFLMNMSHELRTPLNGVVAASELITMSESKTELEDVQEIIRSSSNSLLQIVEHILDFTKFKDGELELSSEPFKLDKALSKINTRFFHKGTHLNLKPEFVVDPDDVPNAFLGDEGRLIEILNHLIENSAKFIKETPKVTLRIKTLEKSHKDALLKFSLNDNGIGISQEHIEKIFVPFSQVDTSSTRQYDGVGIGLSICKQLVELMDGKIWVESKLGQGSTFYFTLNLKRQPSDVYLNIQLLQKPLENGSGISNQKESLIIPGIETLTPIIRKLYESLSESDPQGISAYLSDIMVYNIPKKSELLQRIDGYDYDEAVTILKEIASEIGVQIESATTSRAGGMMKPPKEHSRQVKKYTN